MLRRALAFLVAAINSALYKRLRAAIDIHDLHAGEPVSRCSRSPEARVWRRHSDDRSGVITALRAGHGRGVTSQVPYCHPLRALSSGPPSFRSTNSNQFPATHRLVQRRQGVSQTRP